MVTLCSVAAARCPGKSARQPSRFNDLRLSSSSLPFATNFADVQITTNQLDIIFGCDKNNLMA